MSSACFLGGLELFRRVSGGSCAVLVGHGSGYLAMEIPIKFLSLCQQYIGIKEIIDKILLNVTNEFVKPSWAIVHWDS